LFITKRWPSADMNVLVTGGAGYIGSHTLQALRARGYKAVALDDLSTGYRVSVPAEILVQGDIADEALVAGVIKGNRIDAVVACAAKASVPDSVADPGPYFDTNVAKGIRFLDALRRSDAKHIVFSSSAAVYGDPENIPISEDDQKQPRSPYGLTKLMFEQMLEWYERAYGIRYVCLRYLCAAGAAPEFGLGEDHRPERHLIPSVLLSVLGERPHVEIYGTDYPTEDGTAIRDFVHVMDVADAHISALEHLAAGGESLVLNVGLGTGFSVKDVIRASERVTGRAVPVKLAGRRPGDPAVLVANPQALIRALDWKPRFSQLEEIVATAWEWHRLHPTGFAT
jgi:UDP-glucose 4-epimerase